MEKFIIRIFLSESWTPLEKKVLRDKIEKHFQNKDIEAKFVSSLEDTNVAVFKSIVEKGLIEKYLPPLLPCIYLVKNPHQNPENWVPSYFLKIPRSIELIGLGIRRERFISVKIPNNH